jgi:ureidoglycolate lyase
MISLRPEPLTKAAFAPFGDVIEIEGARHFGINQGFAERYHDLARLDTTGAGGEPIISIFLGEPRPLPIEIKLMERHPIGSQAFYPLQDRDWLVVVAEDPLTPADLRAFRATGRQGVNYARNVWHHPLLVLDPASRFLIVDRKAADKNLEEVWFDRDVKVELRP